VRQAHEPIQNRKRDWSAQRDLQTVSGMSVQPWLHFFEDSRGCLSLQNIVFVGNISETYADPASRLHARGFAALHFAACCEIFVPQNFDFTVPPRSFAALEDDRRDCSLRMTLGGNL